MNREFCVFCSFFINFRAVKTNFSFAKVIHFHFFPSPDSFLSLKIRKSPRNYFRLRSIFYFILMPPQRMKMNLRIESNRDWFQLFSNINYYHCKLWLNLQLHNFPFSQWKSQLVNFIILYLSLVTLSSTPFLLSHRARFTRNTRSSVDCIRWNKIKYLVLISLPQKGHEMKDGWWVATGTRRKMKIILLLKKKTKKIRTRNLNKENERWERKWRA